MAIIDSALKEPDPADPLETEIAQNPTEDVNGDEQIVDTTPPPADTSVGKFIDRDVLEDMYTFPSIDKKDYFANKNAELIEQMKSADATVFQGDFLSQFGERLYRGFTIGNAKTLASIAELTGDSFMKMSEGGSNPRAEVFGHKLRNFSFYISHKADEILAERRKTNPTDEGMTLPGFAADVTASTLTSIALVTLGTTAATAVGASAPVAATVGGLTTASIFGGQSALERYSGARKAGQSYEKSLAFATIDGAGVTALEMVGLHKVFRTTFNRGMSIARRAVTEAILSEAGTEAGQTGLELTIDKISGADVANDPAGKGLTVLEFLAQTIYAGAVGAVSGGLMTASVALPQRAKAITALKQAGMDDATARTTYKAISQEVMDNVLDGVSKDFEFGDAHNQVMQRAFDIRKDYLNRRSFDRASFEKELGELKTLDPAKQMLDSLRAEAGAEVRGEGPIDVNIPGSAETFKTIETMGKAEQTPAQPLDIFEIREPEFSPNTEPAMRTALKGRLKFLNEQMKGAFKAFKDQVNIRVSREEAQKNPESIAIAQAKEDKLFGKFFNMYAEGEAIRTRPEGASLQGSEIQIDTRDLIRISSSFARDIIRTAKANFKAGRATTHAELKFIQQSLNRLINLPGLSRDTRAVLKYQFHNLDTAEKLYKNLPLIEQAVEDAQNDAFIGGITKGVEKLIDFFKGTHDGRGGLRNVKLDADSQKIADAFVREYSSEAPNPTDRWKLLDGTPERTIQFLAAQLKSGKNGVTGQDLSARDYAAAYSTLFDFAQQGRESKLFNQERENVFREKVRAGVIEDVLGGKAPVDKAFANANITDLVMSVMNRLVGTYDTFLSLLARHSGKMLGESFTETVLAANNALRQGEALNMFYRSEVDQALLTSFPELEGDLGKVTEKLARDSEISGGNSVHFTFDAGTEDAPDIQSVSLTRAEAREKYLLSLRPEGEKKLRKSGWNDEAFENLKNALSPADMRFIAAQIRIYSELYERLNEVFKKIAGFDLPRSKNYSPIVTEQDFEDGISMVASLFGKGESPFASVQSKGFLKDTTNAKVSLRDIADFTKLQKYIHDVTHYVGTAETVDRMQFVFRDKKVRDAIASRYGENILNNLERYAEVLVKNSVNQNGDRLFGSANRAVTRLAQGLIAAKFSQIPKQMVAMFAGAEVTGFQNYFKYLATLPEAIRTGEIRELTDSAFLRARAQLKSIDRDTRAISEARQFDDSVGLLDMIPNVNAKETAAKIKKVFDHPKFNDYLFLPTQLGDFGGLIGSAWPVYKYYQSTEGGSFSKEQARIKAIQHADATQQSGDFTQVTPWMLSSNPFLRLMSLFRQAPYQYMNRVLRTLQKVGTDQMDWKEFGKAYAIFFLILPTLFDYVSNVFRLDEDPRTYFSKRAALGPFDEMVIFGDILDWTVVNATAGTLSAITGEEVKGARLDPKDAAGVAGSIYSNIQQAQSAVKDVLEEGVTAESLLKAVTEVSEASLPLTGGAGAVVRQISNAAEGVVLGSEGELADTWRRYFMTLGFSRYSTREE